MFGPDESIWEGGVFSLRCAAAVACAVAWSLTLRATPWPPAFTARCDYSAASCNSMLTMRFQAVLCEFLGP